MTGLPVSQTVYFLAEGLAIESKQYVIPSVTVRLLRCDRISIKLLVKQNNTHPLASTKNGITKAREVLTDHLEKWRGLQAIHMSAVKDHVLRQSPCPVEDEELFLPSSFPDFERNQLNLSKLAHDESLLREAQAYDCILQLRLTIKTISVLQHKRQSNIVGQRNTTRARSRIFSMEAIRDHYLQVYNTNRASLIQLGKLQPNDHHLPHLGVEDLARKPTVAKRQTGDTYRADGKLWALTPTINWKHNNEGKYIVSSNLVLWNSYLLVIGFRSESTPVAPHSPSDPSPMVIDQSPGAATQIPPSGPHLRATPSGRAWDPTVGLHDLDMEEWEKTGELRIDPF
jgi:hypothetical protein